MWVSGHKSENSIRFYSWRLSEVKQKEISHALSSACSVENLESTQTTAIVAMHKQTRENSLGRNTVPNPPVTMQNFASHSQETVNFNTGAFSGANVTINFYNSKWFCIRYWGYKRIFYFLIYFETFVIKVTPNLRGCLSEKKFVRALFFRKPPKTIYR